jgi:hypothetical protein
VPSRGVVRVGRLLATALSVVASCFAVAEPAASAAQTATWGIVAAPAVGQYRTSISDPANGATIQDAVIVYNRTNKPITVDLAVVGASYANGTYQFSAPTSGLAAGIQLAAPRVTLGANQQARVPVTIREPRGVKATALAGITAQSAPVQDGALSVIQRLVVLVKATPSTTMVPLAAPNLLPWGIPTAAGLVLIAFWAIALRRREKRDTVLISS